MSPPKRLLSLQEGFCRCQVRSAKEGEAQPAARAQMAKRLEHSNRRRVEQRIKPFSRTAVGMLTSLEHGGGLTVDYGCREQGAAGAAREHGSNHYISRSGASCQASCAHGVGAILIPPLSKNGRCRHTAKGAGSVEIARYHFHYAFPPKRQRRFEHRERSNCNQSRFQPPLRFQRLESQPDNPGRYCHGNAAKHCPAEAIRGATCGPPERVDELVSGIEATLRAWTKRSANNRCQCGRDRSTQAAGAHAKTSTARIMSSEAAWCPEPAPAGKHFEHDAAKAVYVAAAIQLAVAR